MIKFIIFFSLLASVARADNYIHGNTHVPSIYPNIKSPKNLSVSLDIEKSKEVSKTLLSTGEVLIHDAETKNIFEGRYHGVENFTFGTTIVFKGVFSVSTFLQYDIAKSSNQKLSTTTGIGISAPSQMIYSFGFLYSYYVNPIRTCFFISPQFSRGLFVVKKVSETNVLDIIYNFLERHDKGILNVGMETALISNESITLRLYRTFEYTFSSKILASEQSSSFSRKDDYSYGLSISYHY